MYSVLISYFYFKSYSIDVYKFLKHCDNSSDIYIMCLLIITLFSACKNPLVNVFTKMYFFLQPVLHLLIISFIICFVGK